ncbi:DNA-directed RNA polymerase subunit beta' [Candidatus Falkowbacteria bacterium CG10_big_fil_rev_8_21_14_0_10_43_10]|uniref:DNA-directed RNA polymerase subunit beta' n=1 Tax=Candidatus Falkowbacteria bacterium CG10_big_fil_rev_8_21_14_0_10_43_10 TaxID=1974567 RepID=A0A2H0V2W8_9BACT|nr:MAG: DNA-directed RNA polymerase subunit beta' [Candidatus Falkowbacteria bacterium CG10_big_fil_rev_8_21_14_0_10_43_10]
MLNPIKTTDFDAIKLKLASPKIILSWSHGEVIRPETVNYRTQKPEKDGLFCEKIFGPSKDWECYCGKYKKIRYKGIICDKCGVEVTRSIVRRERMGHIELQSPVTHIWFLRGISSKIGIVLDLPSTALEKVIYFASFVITDVNEELKQATLQQVKDEFKNKKKQIEAEFKKKKSEINKDQNKEKEVEQLEKIKTEKEEKLERAFKTAQEEIKEIKLMSIISEHNYQNLALKYGHIFEAGIGAEAILKLLERIDLKKMIVKLEKDLESVLDSKREKLLRRLKLIKSLSANNLRPDWMVLKVIPVIPPDLRPMVPLDGGRFATSDLNDLYRRVISRNNRLSQLIELNAPEVICRNEKRMLQEAVDALIDNSARHGKTVTASTGQKRMLKSLADILKGKQGRFRQNLLGKRVDYSGRSVIVINPKLKLYQCGLPKKMALELFKPFIISKLIKREIVHNVRSASRYIESGADEVWDILEEIIKEAYVLLNRAPTLHRLGIQAFKPILIEGKAIQIHPLVCSAFNADFDGDQMAVHVPLTKEAVVEARDIMLASHNLLKPATGSPIVTPSQDIVWGAYYLTDIPDQIEEKKMPLFTDEEEATLAYQIGKIGLQQPIRVRIKTGSRKVELLNTSAGRIIFNSIIPEKLRFINEVVVKKNLNKVIKDCLDIYEEDRTVQLVDEMKDLALEYITKSGLSWGMGDLPGLKERDKLIAETEHKIDTVQEQYEEGLLTQSERYAKIVQLWTETKDKVSEAVKISIDPRGSVYSMIQSGARGSWAQLTQIIGMKGLVTSPSGEIIELPVKGNFKKGFDVLEYFIATHGVRKGLSDTALRTANAGYLTRRLIDVAQDVVITIDDCGSKEGSIITQKESEENGTTLIKRIVGRYLAEDLVNAKGKVLLKAKELVSDETAKNLEKEEIKEAIIRSPLNCKSEKGICATCYGYDLSYNKPVKLGTAVGIIAAQSIGEPGTQLTMRTFHTGGVAGEDITQGLPRVEEIFEARPPKRKALVSDVDGVVKIETLEKMIEDEKGRVIAQTTNSKVLKIIYQGTDSSKYYFAEALREMPSGNSDFSKNDGKKAAKKKIKPVILVKDNEEVKRGQALFSLDGVEIKSKESGIAAVSDKYIKVSFTADKAKEFIIPKGYAIWASDGDKITKGTQLTEGSLDLQQYYALCGRLATQKYIIHDIQYVYSSQGQPLNDKHVEIIVRQMFSRVLIKDQGETDLLPGEVIEKVIFDRANKQARQNKKKPAMGELLLLGMTKASLTTDSFLSAASFQETARVLIEAAINGKVDTLEGLKENVIIGRLIPAGTGFRAYDRNK